MDHWRTILDQKIHEWFEEGYWKSILRRTTPRLHTQLHVRICKGLDMKFPWSTHPFLIFII